MRVRRLNALSPFISQEAFEGLPVARMIEHPLVFGSDYSVYVRTVRMCLIEKRVAHELRPVDVFAPDGPGADYLKRHPFGRIPAFEHAGVSIYETGAIVRYIDEVFDGPPLQPSGPLERALCNQLISIADNYVYSSMVWGIYVERVSKPRQGGQANERKIADAMPRARNSLSAIEDLMGASEWLVGAELTLADLYTAPMFNYFLQASEGRELLRQFDRLERWWQRIKRRPSFIATTPVQI